MTFDSLKGSLKEVKGQIKQKWSKLTDDDLTYLEGNVDELVGRIQKAYGEKKEDIKNKIDELKASYLDKNETGDETSADFGEVHQSYKTLKDTQPPQTQSRNDSGREL
jgi:uncharacterized protein YjbJ (UPF0337 family)